MTLLDDLSSLENLHYAWRKARSLLRRADGYVDLAETTAFELDLEAQLSRIQADFRSCSYHLDALRPLPRPKKLKKNVPIDRQFFHVAVRDQVAWIALTNILGPRLDPLMPAWSYGNRIYRAAWFEEDEARQSKRLEIGPYRHASGQLYRKFQHGWPLFRRHVSRTARLMWAHVHPIDQTQDNEADQRAFQVSEADGLVYFKSDYWQQPHDANPTYIHYASLDLERFYPNINRGAIVRAVIAQLEDQDREPIEILLRQMLAFEVDMSDFPEHLSENVEPTFKSFGPEKGIPTGLFAAGFLANAALLPVDQQIQEHLLKRRDIAHFRYVDDHTFLAYTFEALCSWIKTYRRIIEDSGLGVSINPEKFEPASLGTYLELEDGLSGSPVAASEISKAREAAFDETRIDGLNPTKLLTKTLGQVSAIVAANANILDDEDLRERLKLLEWLLLADIPDREIRPDTRAAFAAGQIATLVPLLVQESDGLVDLTRKLPSLETQLNALQKTQGSEESVNVLKVQIAATRDALSKKIKEHEATERAHYKHCFNLLMQAFKEFPGKPRLFYRLVQYCYVTGYPGIMDIAAWCVVQRQQGNETWADYYSGLCLQILSDTVLDATRILADRSTLLSERRAVLGHLKDIAAMPEKSLAVPSSRSAWFHDIASNELSISLMAVSRALESTDERALAVRLLAVADRIRPNWKKPGPSWRTDTGYSAGVWAERTEQRLNPNDEPSKPWQFFFLPSFDAAIRSDTLAVRRYPELLPQSWWRKLVEEPREIPRDDAGWWRDCLVAHPDRQTVALGSAHDALRTAAMSLQFDGAATVLGDAEGYCTVLQWVEHLKTCCSQFDPRQSEWTALEIVRAIVSTAWDFNATRGQLDHLHPANILIPHNWKTSFGNDAPGWEVWRKFARDNPARFRTGGSFLEDYRFSGCDAVDFQDNWDRQRVGIGRLLLGLLQCCFAGPRLWNMRGNERARPLARGTAYGELAISSLTLLFLEACLSARSAENWDMLLRPSLFGVVGLPRLSDMDFDAPVLKDPQEVVGIIQRAQEALEENQIAVSRNQPRQLIPFNLADFAKGMPAGVGDEDVE